MFSEIRKTLEKLSAKHKIDDFEIVLSRGDNTSFNIEQRDLTISSEVGIATMGLRLMKQGKLTYASTTVFDESSLEHVISAALANLEPTALKGFALIPEGLSSDRADAEIVNLVARPKVLRDLLSSTVRNTWEKGKGCFERLNGNGSVFHGESWVYTAHSSQPAYQRLTAFSAYIDLDSRDFEFLVGRKLPRIQKIENLGVEVAKRLPKKSLKPADVGAKGGLIDVIIHPMCLQGIFNTLVAEQIYASNKLAGLSRYKVGEKLASTKVTIYDDATHPDLLSSAPTDNEGVPSRRNVLFDKGVFKTFLYDAETAALDKKKSTGSGMRRPVLAEDTHEAPVRPALRSLVMEPGKVKVKDMVKGIKKGLLLKYLLGLHTADRVTGAFSNTAYVSYVISNGKMVATAEPGTWAMRGNALELLKNITAISAERFNMGTALLPWVKTRLAVG
ncbi:TldD/PmbA family protein [candidate division WOR-3 bacterium]|nr:TldD/PmbA family protein [candidate division WOR-3 bacterium]